MKYYVYETTPTFISIPFGGLYDEYIIENILVYNFITATDNIDKALKKVKKIGGYQYPKQLKWDNGIMTIRVSTPSYLSSIDKLIIICCSESAAEKFERRVLKNNLKRKNITPFNMIEFNNCHNSKEKEKRLLSTKYSK